MSALGDAYDLVGAARDLIRGDDERTAAVWERGAALLGRQALESALAAFWERAAPGMDRMSARTQLVCLGPLLGDAELAGRVCSAWGALSGACHVRLYAVSPGAAELATWLDAVWDLCETVARRTARRGDPARAAVTP